MATREPGPVELLLEPLAGDLVELFADDRRLMALAEPGERYIAPHAEVVFHGAEGVVLTGYRGFGGLVEGWREWLSTFASYRLEVEDLRGGEGRVVVLVRQSARTIHGNVEMPSRPSAAVFTVEDGRLTRLAFYLDRADAARVEGVDVA